MLFVHVLLPSETEPLATFAKVRWTRESTGRDDMPAGVGLEFIDTDPSILAKFQKFAMTVREPLMYAE